MIIWGINEGAHDAALSVISGDQILFAAHAERYSKKKNDWFINDSLINDALEFGEPDKVGYYEKPILKRSRVFLKGGHYERPRNLYRFSNIKTFEHHYSHASAGFFTSGMNDATIVVADAIGEWNTTTIWSGYGNKIKKIYSINYPVSFGLFYSAFTKLIGLKPNEEEYILMGMAAYGDWKKYYNLVHEYFPSLNSQKYNLHYGIQDWNIPITEQDRFDIAAAVQKVFSERIFQLMRYAKSKNKSKNLVFMGGTALNCSANTNLWDIFDNIWIMPNPGDAGSSLGAALAINKEHVSWQGPYLGTNILGEYPVDAALSEILNNGVAAVANGRAEFGPRALGNRSILADPRDKDIKDKVNKIKKRELFRPFAPVVLEEYAHEWFDMPTESIPYMQYAVKCKKPNLIPSVVHVDGTSRIQTVSKSQHLGLYSTIKNFYNITGVPVLLNTSLNIKGQPLINDVDDCEAWQNFYGHKVLTSKK